MPTGNSPKVWEGTEAPQLNHLTISLSDGGIDIDDEKGPVA